MQSQKRMGSRRNVVSITTSFALGFLLVASIVTPHFVHASVFSFISNIFSPQTVQAEDASPNSQNIPLLQASLSPDPQASSTGDTNTIVEGTSLSSSVSNQPVSEHTVGSDQISLYVVHQGDTLPEIAKMFGVTTNTIVWGNDIKNNKITPGQTLVILPISGVQHIVKSGDTVQSIAKLYKGDVNEIIQYNNLTQNSKLAAGDVIIVPDGEFTSPPSISLSKPGKSGSGVGITLSTGGTGSSPSAGSHGTGSPVYVGYYMRPILGGIKTQGLHGHNGVDLASSYGTSILASAAGDVIISKDFGWNGGYGSYIVIKHPNGTQTLYGHLSATSVSVGDHVEQGQVIGAMGSTGESTGVHLHFEIRGARNPF